MKMKKSIVILALLMVLALAVIPAVALTEATNTVPPTDYSMSFGNVGTAGISAPSYALKANVAVQDALQHPRYRGGLHR
jgi:hypothetical protein